MDQDSGSPEPDGASDERKAALVGQILRGELTPQEACESEGLSEAELKSWVRSYTRAARRAIDNQVAAALAAHGLEVDERPATELTGNLGCVGLPELIQTIQLGRKDAHIRIDHEGGQSELWCEQGDIIDAASAQLIGSAAVYRILAIERGQLHADFVPVERSRTVYASTQALMLEAAKRADECAEIRSRLGDTLNIYVPSSSAPSELEIEPDQAAVLRAFDGERSVEDVVYQSELPDLETLVLIERLLDQEWLVLKPFHSIRRVSRAPSRPPVVPSSIVDASFRPMATSLASRLSWHATKHRLWASAFAGVAVVAGAFAIGFYSARTDEPPVASAALVTRCGANLAPLPGGVCMDRDEVTAGDYQACVRAGACEAAQSEPEAGAEAGAAAASQRGVAPGGTEASPGGGASPGGAALAGGTAAPGAIEPGVPGGAVAGSAAPGGAAPGDRSDEGASPATVPASVSVIGAAPDVAIAAGAAVPGGAASQGPATGELASGRGASDGTAPGVPTPGAPPATGATHGAGPSQGGNARSAASDERADEAARCNAGLPGRERYALNCVTYQQARQYCGWRGGRLPLRNEWELAASPAQASLGVRDLVGGLSEWAIEPATGTTEASRERSVVLGGGLDTGARTGGSLTRLYMNANAQGRGVGFRCVVRADSRAATAAIDEPFPR